jgi:xanthine dehydrogenase YagR molybdenum-binding subunit
MSLAIRPIGASVNRVEGGDKVTGRAKYTGDHEVTGVTYAVLVQSEIPHGRVLADSLAEKTREVLAAPGVLHVLTPLNCPVLEVLPCDLTFDLPLERRPPLSDLTAQHVGQHVALVIADSPENATYAASLLELEYEPLPPLLHFQEVLASDPLPDEKDGQIRHGSYLPDHFVKLEEEKLQDARGDREEPHGVRVAARYTTPINAHYPIELSSTIASWEGKVLTLYDSTRWITGERKALAEYLGLPEENIHILSPLVGGAFGSKSFLDSATGQARAHPRSDVLVHRSSSAHATGDLACRRRHWKDSEHGSPHAHGDIDRGTLLRADGSLNTLPLPFAPHGCVTPGRADQQPHALLHARPRRSAWTIRS